VVYKETHSVKLPNELWRIHGESVGSARGKRNLQHHKVGHGGQVMQVEGLDAAAV